MEREREREREREKFGMLDAEANSLWAEHCIRCRSRPIIRHYGLLLVWIDDNLLTF
jgi:hypothetical protein